MSVCLSIEGVDLVFGSKPQKAFAALDQGKNREVILKETGQLVGVQNISFQVNQGEIFVLMGLSGSGKSSLIRCLNGMNGRKMGTLRGNIWYIDPTSGHRISIPKCEEKKLREIRRHHISMVFQQFGLMPWRTVWQNIEYPLEIQKISKEARKKRVEEKLDLVGLTSFAHRFPHELSGGMQQRVGLARAFVTQAGILLMDEPFSALDPLHRKHLQDEVLDLQAKLKKTIIFVTHDLAEAARIGNRMVILEAGKVLQMGTPEEIFVRPACEQVRKFTSIQTQEISFGMVTQAVSSAPILDKTPVNLH
jgi:glycine betaine/proline transport system ATP-binding protein